LKGRGKWMPLPNVVVTLQACNRLSC